MTATEPDGLIDDFDVDLVREAGPENPCRSEQIPFDSKNPAEHNSHVFPRRNLLDTVMERRWMRHF
jgi:hypothetical protein